MAAQFSKVDLIKLWHDVQNEETLICAKFGKDLFNISKVIGRKKWPSFFWLTVYTSHSRMLQTDGIAITKCSALDAVWMSSRD